MPQPHPVDSPPLALGSTPSPVVSQDVQESLLDLVRVALAVATGRARTSALERALERTAVAGEPAAVFVTLTEGGDLRGCMGSLDPDRPLRESVVASALSATLDDPRFRPVAADELPAIHVDISVLGPMAPLVDPTAFVAGRDGIVVERGGRRGLLLPEVATDQGWGAREMFGAVCRKAGLPVDAWRDPRTQLRTFRTARFGGPAVPAH